MKRIGMVVGVVAIVLACGRAGRALAQAPATSPAAATVDEATQKKLDGKVNKVLKGVAIEDSEKASRAKAIIRNWLVTMTQWHQEHNSELGALWKQWGQARAVVPKDEFPGEVIAHKIDAVYASLKPSYQQFLSDLRTELTPEQIDAIKEAWSRSPGMTRTYNAYLEAAPDLKDADKQVIHDQLAEAREDAMLTDADKEIVNIYKVHKVKVEEYIGSLEWAKLHQAFANKGKAEKGSSTQAK